jgi:hypothetical protein
MQHFKKQEYELPINQKLERCTPPVCVTGRVLIDYEVNLTYLFASHLLISNTASGFFMWYYGIIVSFFSRKN